MARSKRPRAPRSAPGRGKLDEVPSARVGNDDDLFRLAARMRVAEQDLHAAMDQLARAERRLSESRRDRRTTGHIGRPAWFLAAVRKEQAAGDTVEQVYRQIARSRAHTMPGLAIKLRLLADLYGQVLGEPPDESDTVAVLLHSLIEDVSEA